MARKKVSGKSPKAKRTAPSLRPKSRASTKPKANTRRVPLIGDFTHTLYWDGAAAIKLTDHPITHQIIFVERNPGRSPNDSYRNYNIPSGATASQIAAIVADRFEQGPFHSAAPRNKDVLFIIDNDFYHTVHVFYTDYYRKGIVVNDDGRKVKIFGPETDLEVWARTV